MLTFIDTFNVAVFLLFLCLYAYQVFYVFVSLFNRKKKQKETAPFHKYGVVIAARNESNVIAHLIDSIKCQSYPGDLVDIFIIADNCTDDTADIARGAGAIVYERQNKEFVGKGYALDFAFNAIKRDYGDSHYDAYFIFDADNLLDKKYIEEMNRVFSRGYKVVTSYRNSKNYDSNWISAGYSLWFLREARFINQSRMLLKTSCAVSGTGFMIDSSIIRKNDGWKYHLLTEDIQFTVDTVISGEIIGYCGSAFLYDEQPCTFKQSWIQRLRWCKGFYQVFMKYGGTLFRTLFKKRSFSCYDLLMTISPVMFITLFSIILNAIMLMYSFWGGTYIPGLAASTAKAIAASFVNFYIVLYAFGLITTITEWDNIGAKSSGKILYTFTFPIFIFTYMPISIAALFKKVAWTPIKHTIGKSIEEM